METTISADLRIREGFGKDMIIPILVQSISEQGVSDDHRNFGLREFESVISPFQNQLYRTALILTGSPRFAKILLRDAFLKARLEHPRFHNNVDFGLWMFRTLFNTFQRTQK